MPTAPRETVLCRYGYDPLDRLTDCVPSAEAHIQRFYCKSRLATEVQGAVQHSVFQHEDQLLAQLRREDARVDTTLLATDQQRSVLNALDATRPHPLAYTPYGHRPAENGLLSLLGFNGERPDPVTGHYLLGNGYRAFNPVLMRFNSPDSWSPFGEGGLNAYAYCDADPVNNIDPNGHSLSSFLSTAINWLSKIAEYVAIKGVRYLPVYGTKVKSISNVRTLISDLTVFDDTYKEGLRLSMIGHGNKENSGIQSTDKFRSHHDLNDLFYFSGVNFDDYTSVRTIVCYSADNSLGQNIANLTGLPTKAFHGPVGGAIDGTGTNSKSLILRGGLINFLIPVLAKYQPVTFYPNTPRRSPARMRHPSPVKPTSASIRGASI
ncbi:RHS repeat-associated core domain-containing protein [Pseudomonas sp. G2-4]|uniref:RHS repeat-associated core domain-containing protein n=1 Tax=Pseudomonas sp. G2-4 TaxID=1506334 RepID=UPI0024B9418B|nr:RHS repeat-associated core domain-containing protein [Pseudomonas sp. G2-4]WHS60959.1 RHS repeat-associated core domain-containing protein [Pseudomonas sp. G2-4]